MQNYEIYKGNHAETVQTLNTAIESWIVIYCTFQIWQNKLLPVLRKLIRVVRLLLRVHLIRPVLLKRFPAVCRKCLHYRAKYIQCKEAKAYLKVPEKVPLVVLTV